MGMFLYLSFILVVGSTYGDNVSNNKDAPIVNTQQGALKGIFLKTLKNKEFAAFMSVPYAKPPIGKLRFKDPVEMDAWSNVLDATRDSGPCIQSEFFSHDETVFGNEDCLYLNVYAPKELDNNALLPVMVYFHGGSWLNGIGNKWLHGPERFLNKDIVLVGVNFRLGVLGLFTTGDEAAPGNWLFKDQNLALKWVQKHIRNFGGDPERVTIFGSGSGAASVHYHMISPLSRGLFHRAILQSGSALCSWANFPPGYQKKQFDKLAIKLNCPTDDTTSMVNCLRGHSPEDIVIVTKNIFDWDVYPIAPFGPVIEPKSPNSFIIEDPRVSLDEGRFAQVPVMMGFNMNEGGFFTSELMAQKGLLEEFSSNLFDIAPIAFNYQSSGDVHAITAEIMNFYIKGPELLRENYINISRIFSDALITSGMDESVQLSLPKSTNPIYFYFFTYKGKKSYSSIVGDATRDYGVTHVDELMYLFNAGTMPKLLNKNDQKMSNTLITIWTNFASTGNPTKPTTNTEMGEIPEWPPLDSVDKWKNMEIGNKFIVHEDLFPTRRRLWRSFPLWPKTVSKVYVHKIKSEL